MNLNEVTGLGPVGPHIEGLIRFSRDAASDGSTEQKPVFELLSRVHAETPQPGEVPKMVTHPLSDKLTGVDSETPERRLLNEIPIRLMFSKPENNLSAQYKAFDRNSGQLLCCGNGQTAARRGALGESPVSATCRSPDNCVFASDLNVNCQLHLRLKVQVEGSEDPLALVEFQSSSINSYRTLSAKLKMLSAMFGGLRGLPLRLTSWSKSSQLSGYEPFYCANIELREGVDLIQAKTLADSYRNTYAGIDLEAMEIAVEEMEKSSPFALGQSESVVTYWTPAGEIGSARPRSRLTPVNELMQPSMLGGAIAAAVSRARAQERAGETIAADTAQTDTVAPTDDGQQTAQVKETVQTLVDATIPEVDQPLPVVEVAGAAAGLVEDEFICL